MPAPGGRIVSPSLPMISKCANPACATPFHYMRDGRLFQVDRDRSGHLVSGPFLMAGNGLPHHLEHFWLCGACCQRMTLRLDPELGVVTAPLPADRVSPLTAA